MCHHYGLCSSIEHSIALFGIGPGSRMLQFASCSFDASVLEVTLALCSGAQLHLMPGSALPLGDALLGLLHERGITHAVLSPSALATLPAEACLPSLETVIVGGEVFPPALAAQWAGRCHVFNAYGPTEATIMATVHRCDGPDHFAQIHRLQLVPVQERSPL